jgi:subtilisin family serine protease
MLSLDLNMTGDSIRVGLIDAGVDTQQPLLKEFFWKTPKVFPKTPWDKGSIGYDYIKKISDPMEDQKPGIESHGTHVAGLVTLRAFASWLQEFKTMPLKDHIKVYCLKIAGISRIFGTEQVGIPDFSLPSNALDDGIKNEIHLFNLSLRGPENSLLRTFIDANSQVALIVSAAGNNTLDLDSTAFSTYNGSFRDEKTHRPLPNVIFVAALTDQGDLESDSNHGKETVEIAAPGNQITSTIHSVPGQSLLGLKSGTSQAAPLVTATAAILLAEHSGASPSRVKERILNTCDHDKTLEQLVKDGCRLNMAKAVIANYDLIETSSGQWKRGQIDKTQLGIVDDKGKSVDSAEVDRMLVSDENGNVRIWMSGGEGQIRGRLSGTKIFIKPRDGETCSSSSAGLCNVDVSDTKDIVLRWGG